MTTLRWALILALVFLPKGPSPTRSQSQRPTTPTTAPPSRGAMQSRRFRKREGAVA